ncbi:hypothetical protein QEH56_15130 [Pelagicoccus enzymogenes]|uniref:hypothetical protein n=1 Tax=Pelagicoccus enzymogenes TaxID=2773457 RepID=UPI00280D502C|nr:hypothetical protein [Pelagicoccus enzymogenes]MDQ8199497.1 hypothetical protein [Pelagicoccus enzymogenes]
MPIPHPETDQVAWDILGRDDFSLAVLRGAFESKGYRFVDEGSVDFFVGVRAATGRAGLPQGNASEGLGFSYSRLAKSMGDPFPGYEAPPDEKYDDSRSSEDWENQRVPGFYVIVEAFDADTRERVWSGWARAQTGFAYSNDEKRAAVLANLVRAFGN